MVQHSHGLRWCPKHQCALTHTEYQGWHWHPLTAWTLALAWEVAVWGKCERQITVEIVPCPACLKEKEEAA